MTTRTVASLLTALALVLAGCGSEPGTPPPTETRSPPEPGAPDVGGAPTAATSPSPSPSSDVEALDFSAPALAGGTIDGQEFVGRDVVLWMWAPW